jgi:M6 family metalloprotease-like protein
VRLGRLGAIVGFFIVGGLLWTSSSWALERPTRAQIERYRRDGSLKRRIEAAKALGNHLVAPRLAQRAAHKLQKAHLESQGLPTGIPAPPPAWRGMPTSGTVKVLVVLIAFSDMPYSNTQASIDDKIFGDGEGGFPRESLHNYYWRASYNDLDIQGTTLPWYTTAYPRSGVTQTTTGRQNLIKEVLNAADAGGHDFTQYDNDGDGAVDYFLVLWTGQAGAWASFWWGYMTSFSDPTYLLDGKRLDTYSWQWEANPYPGTFSPRVTIHETGHALGLPDYYDYDGSVGPDGGVGGLDMMDANQGDHNCFSKFLLDWIDPVVYGSGTRTEPLDASGNTRDAVVFMTSPPTDQFGEFFMVQNRHRVENDTGFPSDGLLVWHVDARLNVSGTNFVYNNSYTDHKLLRLMEADGLEEIEAGLAADAGDYYNAGEGISPVTSPSTYRYDGTASLMSLRDISADGPSMTVEVYEYGATPTLTIDDVSVTEGDGGTQTATFTVTLSPTSGEQVTVDWATADGTATGGAGPGPGVDYYIGSDTLTFDAGQATRTIDVTIAGDTVGEANETFYVNLSGATNAGIEDGQGVGTILDNETPLLSVSDVSLMEGNGALSNANFTVALSRASAETVTVICVAVEGTASGDSDFYRIAGVLGFAPGETTKTVPVYVLGDLVSEPTETFTLHLSDAAGATIADAEGTATIMDDDGFGTAGALAGPPPSTGVGGLASPGPQ